MDIGLHPPVLGRKHLHARAFALGYQVLLQESFLGVEFLGYTHFNMYHLNYQ